MDEALIEQAKQIVSLIRSQNWKNGGVLSVDVDEAEAVVLQAMQTAYSQGLVDATKRTSESMLRAFDAQLLPDQKEYLQKILDHQAEGYDPTVMVGGPNKRTVGQ